MFLNAPEHGYALFLGALVSGKTEEYPGELFSERYKNWGSYYLGFPERYKYGSDQRTPGYEGNKLKEPCAAEQAVAIHTMTVGKSGAIGTTENEDTEYFIHGVYECDETDLMRRDRCVYSANPPHSSLDREVRHYRFGLVLVRGRSLVMDSEKNPLVSLSDTLDRDDLGGEGDQLSSQDSEMISVLPTN
eukprot:IDg20129t1